MMVNLRVIATFVISVINDFASSALITPIEENRKKKGQNLVPLLLIPFIIQAKIIPLMLFQMKLMALKALMLGKLAVFIIFLNVVRNTILGTDYIDEQYESETLAYKHYGYNGSPEYGAWINRKKRKARKRQTGKHS